MSSVHRTAEWMRLARRLRPEYEAALPLPCVNGGGRCVVQEGQKFDLAHIQDAALYPELALDPDNIGVSCVKHNRSAGGTAGANKTNRARKRKTEGEFPTWGRT